jgi:hypothetical protein
MELKPFIKTHVAPGEPLTAQAWNDLVDAIDDLHQFLASTGHMVRVKITTPGIDLESVRVVASRAEGAPVQAVAPLESGGDHVLAGLELGAWTVTARAPGYEPASKPVDVDGSGDTSVELALTRLGPAMPDVFGLPFAEAAERLAAAGIPVLRLLDFTGRDIPPSSPDPDDAAAPVLVQWPASGTTVSPTGGARLVVASPVELERGVEMPVLTGLTQLEAQKALEAIGLQVGKVSVLNK